MRLFLSAFPLRLPINVAKRASYSSLALKNRKAEPLSPTQLGCQNASLRTHQPEQERLIYASACDVVAILWRRWCSLARQGERAGAHLVIGRRELNGEFATPVLYYSQAVCIMNEPTNQPHANTLPGSSAARTRRCL
jgi:hypothetical protein